MKNVQLYFRNIPSAFSCLLFVFDVKQILEKEKRRRVHNVHTVGQPGRVYDVFSSVY